MSTKNIVPRLNGEGGIGTEAKKWGVGYFNNLSVGGTATGVTPTAGDNSNKFATTAFVQDALESLENIETYDASDIISSASPISNINGAFTVVGEHIVLVDFAFDHAGGTYEDGWWSLLFGELTSTSLLPKNKAVTLTVSVMGVGLVLCGQGHDRAGEIDFVSSRKIINAGTYNVSGMYWT